MAAMKVFNDFTLSTDENNTEFNEKTHERGGGEDGGCAGSFAARTPPAPLIIEMIPAFLSCSQNANLQGICYRFCKKLE